jgi:hypothetical protein
MLCFILETDSYTCLIFCLDMLYKFAFHSFNSYIYTLSNTLQKQCQYDKFIAQFDVGYYELIKYSVSSDLACLP